VQRAPNAPSSTGAPAPPHRACACRPAGLSCAAHGVGARREHWRTLAGARPAEHAARRSVRTAGCVSRGSGSNDSQSFRIEIGKRSSAGRRTTHARRAARSPMPACRRCGAALGAAARGCRRRNRRHQRPAQQPQRRRRQRALSAAALAARRAHALAAAGRGARPLRAMCIMPCGVAAPAPLTQADGRGAHCCRPQPARRGWRCAPPPGARVDARGSGRPGPAAAAGLAARAPARLPARARRGRGARTGQSTRPYARAAHALQQSMRMSARGGQRGLLESGRWRPLLCCDTICSASEHLPPYYWACKRSCTPRQPCLATTVLT